MTHTTSREISLASAEPASQVPQTTSTKRLPVRQEAQALEDDDCEEDGIAYKRFTPARKLVIVAIVSLPGFNASMDTMAVSAVIPEIATEFNTTGSVINISNALYLVLMAASPLFWGPLSQVVGRRIVSPFLQGRLSREGMPGPLPTAIETTIEMAILSTTLFATFSLGTALSPNLVAYFVFRCLTAFETTAFYVLGSSCIGDIYRPQERSTALGWFLFGTVVGPALGPFIGGVIVSFQTWRTLFWLHAALGALAAVLVVLFLPETIHHKLKDEITGTTVRQRLIQLWPWMNPFRVIKLLRHPSLLVAYTASAALIWKQQCLLTPIRYVINPRFNLTSPLLSGLFFLAPGLGYLLGTILGGRWADATVIKARKKRGKRVPEDRLRSTLVSLLLLIPGSLLVYGWSIEERVGGIPLPVITMFLQGVGQMVCFPSLNAYCLDVMPQNGAEVISGAYFFRYIVASIGTASVLPAIQSIGTGWFSTLTAALVLLSGVGVGLLVKHGH